MIGAISTKVVKSYLSENRFRTYFSTASLSKEQRNNIHVNERGTSHLAFSIWSLVDVDFWIPCPLITLKIQGRIK